MSRVRVAFLLLALLAAFALAGHLGVQRTAGRLDEGLTGLQQSMQSRNYVRGREQLTALQQLCRQKQHLLTVFVRRDLVNALYTTLCGIEAYLEDDYVRDAQLELARARAQVQALRWQYFDIA